MKRTSQAAIASHERANAQASAAAAAVAEFEAMLARRKKLDQAVESAPVQIAETEHELAAMRSSLAAKERDIVFVDDADVQATQKEIIRLANAIDAKDLELRRLKARVEALEAMAPDIDAQVDAAVCAIRVEASNAAVALCAELAAEVRERASELQLTYAKIRALTAIVPLPKTTDFLDAAKVPDLDECGYFATTANLLSLESEASKVAEAEIKDRMGGITSALRAARAYSPYVPVAKRPGPYQFRGSNSGPQKGMGGAIGPGEPPIPYTPEPPAFKGYRDAEPYQIKGDQGGIRTRQAAVEMDMGHAILQAAESRDH